MSDAPASDLAPLPTAGVAAKVVPGEHWLGMRMGGMPLGAACSRIAAKDGGLSFRWEVSAQMGPRAMQIEGSLELDPDLRLIRYEETKVEGGAHDRALVARGADGRLAYSREARPADQPDAEPKRDERTIEAEGLIMDVPQLLYICAALDLPVGPPHAVKILDHKRGSAGAGKLSRLDDAEIEHGGQTATARVFEIVEQSGKTTRAFVVGDAFVKATVAGAPLVMVAGASREEVTRAEERVESPEQKQVRAAALEYMRGSLLGQTDLVARTMDFASVRRRMAERLPAVGALSDGVFEKQFLAKVAASAGTTSAKDAESQLSLIDIATEIAVRGEAARVAIPGKPPLELGRGGDGRWRVVWWDAFARKK